MKKAFTFALALLATASAWAYDFKSSDLYYNIIDEAAKTVEVTYEYYWDSNNYSSLPSAVTIPETVSYKGTSYSVTSIGNWAFYRCSALTQVTIPNSVTSIGDYAFSNCSALTQVNIPDGVESIGDQAFSYCSALTQVNIPNGVESIGSNAFEGTALYNNADNWTNNVLYIDNCLIKAKEELSGNYEITAGTRVIADWAFEGCSTLTQITIPNSVESIGTGAFFYCFTLTDINIPNDVTNIGESAFNGCIALTQINVENENPVYCSEDGVLFNKEKNTLIQYPEKESAYTIPYYVTSIGNNAFAWCFTIKQITIPNSVTSIGEGAFWGSSSLTQINVENENPVYCSEDGVLFNKEKNTLIQYPAR